jgi:hypothetical protein
MSLTGNLTPLNLNTIGLFLQNRGLRINAKAQTHMGTSTAVGNYTPGTTVSTTCLSAVSSALAAASASAPSAYSSLITMGRNICPALTGAAPLSYTSTYTGTTAKYGWLRLIPLQAYQEFHINTGSYSDFLSTFSQASGFIGQYNTMINALLDSATYLDGVYSNMDDLVTGDIAGVSLSMFHWGQDLIKSGRAIDLATIDTFGNPENLLITLQKNRALTKAVNLALLTAGFSADDIDTIVAGREVTPDEQKRMYAAFSIVVDTDLADTLIPINCQTTGLESLADLLNPRKLFPNSYKTLSVPQYNTMKLPTNSKTYYLLYNGDQPSTQVLEKFGTRLTSLYPLELASTCDAFSVSMMQIKHIKTINIEKFSQVVSNLESVNDLSVNGTNIPTDQALATASLATIAKGSGERGLYTLCDFFGAMSGLTYDWATLESQIKLVQTPALVTAYTTLVTAINSQNDETYTGPSISTVLTQIQTELTNIRNSNPIGVSKLNVMYESFGTHLQKEQDARALGLKDLQYLTTGVTDIYSFAQSLNQYAADTEKFGSAQVLEAISNPDDGGNNIIGGMREARNAQRLGLIGAEQDNEVGIEKLSLPKVNGAVPTTPSTDPVTGNIIDVPLVTKGPLVNVPVFTGGPTGNGSLGTSPVATLVPPNLNIVDTADVLQSSIITPDEAVHQVTICNCDCWDLIA